MDMSRSVQTSATLKVPAPEGGQREGQRGGQREISVKCDACEPRNPTKREEYQRHPQGVLYSTGGAQTSKTLVTDVVNAQDSQEQAP
eukprot:2375763-Pyramimonas_sp.AAC.1